MTVIDAHNHPDWLGHDLPKFLANMDRFGIEEICLLARHCPPNRYLPLVNAPPRILAHAPSERPVPPAWDVLALASMSLSLPGVEWISA
ncbi:MAG: hypothetical protein OXH73_03720 [Caldilineaceae bacterium]|nr:hypothetical protein [Caldilineaceae bacterium]